TGAVYFSADHWVGRASAEGDVRFLVRQAPTAPVVGMAVDAQGTLYAINGVNNVIYRLADGATPAWVAVAGVDQPAGGFQDGSGTQALLRQPRSPVSDGAGQIYFIDSGNLAVRRMALDGTVVTVAGRPTNTALADGQGAAAGFAQPREMVRMPDG